jgi:hypothetical protein
MNTNMTNQNLEDTIQKFIKAWMECMEIRTDPSRNTRTFRKAIEQGEHPLTYITFREAEYIKNEPETAWRIILELIKKSKSNIMLSMIAAGPLENLINGYPDKFIMLIEEQARKNVRFRKCLTGLWQSGIPAPIWNRIVAACGNTWGL